MRRNVHSRSSRKVTKSMAFLGGGSCLSVDPFSKLGFKGLSNYNQAKWERIGKEDGIHSNSSLNVCQVTKLSKTTNFMDFRGRMVSLTYDGNPIQFTNGFFCIHCSDLAAFPQVGRTAWLCVRYKASRTTQQEGRLRESRFETEFMGESEHAVRIGLVSETDAHLEKRFACTSCSFLSMMSISFQGEWQALLCSDSAAVTSVVGNTFDCYQETRLHLNVSDWIIR